MADGELKGGDWALAGFYYQITVFQGLATLQNQPLSAATADDDTRLLVTSFTNNANTVFPFEEVGQDISLVAGEHCLLVQTKHSGKPEQKTFDQSDFREVLASFAHSLKRTEEQGGPAVCGCILITNRFPNDVITSIKAIIQQCRKALGLQPSNMNVLPTITQAYENEVVSFKHGNIEHDGPVQGLVEKWLTEFDQHRNPKKQPEKAEVTYALRVLPGMYFVTQARLSEFDQAFDDFAQRYGAKPDEIKRAKNELCGRLLSETNPRLPLTREDFVYAITQNREARELTPIGMGAQCVEEWDAWCKSRDARLDWIVNRFDLQSEFDRALLDGKRIIFLIGDGGCGKTELLTQLAQPRIEVLHTGSSFDGFVMLESCPEIRDKWLEETLGKWANRGTVPEQRLDDPYSRLTIANPSVMPILLWIGLDGLDEHFPSDRVLVLQL